jgi:ribonuclease-3
VIQNIFYAIRLLFYKKKKSYFALYKVLGFFPNNIALYEEALLHKSSYKENRSRDFHNNERLEFLGDAILDAIIAEAVYKKFPAHNEGFLTNTRSKIVKRETMDKVAIDLGLHNLIVSSPYTRNTKNHILGNALEAFIGAIYLDRGYKKTALFIDKKILQPYINIDFLAKKEVNFKSKLLEWSQKYRVNISFELINSYTDNSSNPIFQSQVLLNGLIAGVGTGFTKKESQQRAAQMSLKKIKKDKSFAKNVIVLNEKEKSPIDMDVIEKNECE